MFLSVFTLVNYSPYIININYIIVQQMMCPLFHLSEYFVLAKPFFYTVITLQYIPKM